MTDQSSEQGTIRYVRCPSCGTPNLASVGTCPRCGKSLAGNIRPAPSQSAPSVVCSKCRKSLPAGSKFCGYCGAPLPGPPAQAVPQTPQRPQAPAQGRAPAGPVPTPSTPPILTGAPPPATKAAAPAPRPAGPPPANIAPPAAPRAKAPAATPAPIPKSQPAVPVVAIPKVVVSFSEVRPDGSLGKTVNVEKELVIGREDCEVRYPDDALLSPRHASVTFRDGKLRLKDLGSQNGTFIKQRHDTELRPGDVFLLGRELFRFTTQSLEESQSQASPQGTMVMKGAPKLQRGPITAKLEHIQLTGEAIEEFSLGKPETTLGRSNGDLVFKNDPYMSGTHARITAQPGRFILQDLKSTNGIYRRIVGEVELRDGDEFFLGEQRFRVALKTS